MKNMVLTILACLMVVFSSGCSERGEQYLDAAVQKAQELYENFDAETFLATVKGFFDAALEKGTEIVGDISGMTNDELAVAIKTAIFGDGSSDENPGLGFNVSVTKSDISENSAEIETVISFKIGVMVLEKTVNLSLERNDKSIWFIANFEISSK